MDKKTKPILEGVPPKGIIPPSITRNGITWRCVSVDLKQDIFTFKSDQGDDFVRKWSQLQHVLTTHKAILPFV